MAQLFDQMPWVFDQVQPDMVIIQGDTASALASAIIGKKKNLVIGHIEAGLRTHDLSSPFPEEIHRQNISKLTKWHFCPTELARQNLLRENIPQENIFVTGNTSVDMVLDISQKLKTRNWGVEPVQRDGNRPFFLITLHRRESQGSPLIRITNSLLEFAKNNPAFDFILPLHPNFCPTELARQNLLRENIPQENIFVTGNTSVDMVLDISQKLKTRNWGVEPVQRDGNRPFFLITLHRRESQGSPLIRITNSLLEFAKNNPAFDFILPLHPNPATSDMIKSHLGHQDNILLIPPLTYPQFIQLMAKAYAIVTDSGGIQEEAPSLNTPVIVVRDNTERTEGLENGCLRLAGTEKDNILYELNLLITDKAHYKRMQQANNPFGDGRAAERITGHLIDILTNLPNIRERSYLSHGQSKGLTASPRCFIKR